MIPESAAEQFRKESPKAVFQKIYDSPPDIVYYKLTHRYPKSSSIPGLAIFDEVLKQRIAELTGKEKEK